MVFYNGLIAFAICALAYVIGEWVSTATRAWIPSVFVTAVVFLVGYWTFLPYTLTDDTTLTGMAGGIGAMLLVTHIGTIISVKQLAEQWRTIVVCLCGLAGMVAIAWIVCPLFMDKTLLIMGLPPLTGGVVATQTMQAAAEAKGLDSVYIVFAVSCYCIQGFFGYPLTAVCLQKYGKQLLGDLRSGAVVLTEEEKEANKNIGMTAVADESNVKKLLPRVPDKWNSAVLMLCKLGLVAWLASLLGQISFGGFKISGMIWALILGVIFCSIGFLESNILNRANSYWIVMFALLLVIFGGLKDCTPAMLGQIIGPMVAMILIGVAGMGIFAFIIAKILKMNPFLAFANGLTALYGFPCDAIITEATCNGLTTDPDERNYLMSKMFPSMIVGGFITVTITSVLLAGVFANML